MSTISTNSSMNFKMPDSEVNLNAVFDPDAPVMYNCIVVNPGTGSGRYKEGDIVTANTDDLSNTYEWGGWQIYPDIPFDQNGYVITFTMPNFDVEVIPQWQR